MTPTQQLIAKLRECETELPKLDGAAWEDKMIELANANPTVIAMLERVMELRAELLIDSSISATTTRKLLKFDAALDALAREALKEKTDGK